MRTNNSPAKIQSLHPPNTPLRLYHYTHNIIQRHTNLTNFNKYFLFSFYMTYSMRVTRLVNQHLDNIKRSVRNVNFIIFFYNCLLIISVTVDFSQQSRFFPNPKTRLFLRPFLIHYHCFQWSSK